MTIEQRDKYAYELMVKNNPEEAVKQLLLKDKIIEKTQQSYDEEYNLSHKLSLELSIEKDKVFELSNHLTSYSSEETMLKEIEKLKNIIKQKDNTLKEVRAYIEENKVGTDCCGEIYIGLDEMRIEELIKILKG